MKAMRFLIKEIMFVSFVIFSFGGCFDSTGAPVIMQYRVLNCDQISMDKVFLETIESSVLKMIISEKFKKSIDYVVKWKDIGKFDEHVVLKLFEEKNICFIQGTSVYYREKCESISQCPDLDVQLRNIEMVIGTLIDKTPLKIVTESKKSFAWDRKGYNYPVENRYIFEKWLNESDFNIESYADKLVEVKK
jgi:hypothetical protein